MEFQNRETERQQFEDLIFPTPPSTIYVSHFPKTDEKAYLKMLVVFTAYIMHLFFIPSYAYSFVFRSWLLKSTAKKKLAISMIILSV